MIVTPFGHAVINDKGYPRVKTRGPFRDKYVHRLSFESVAGRPIREGFTVHHMGPKTCWCPHNLVELQGRLHVSVERPRHPYTGKFLGQHDRMDWE